MGNKNLNKKNKDFKNKKKAKIHSKKYANEIIQSQILDYDIISSDNNEAVLFLSDEITASHTGTYSEFPGTSYHPQLLQDMENYLDAHKEEIEETYSFIKTYFEKQLNKTGIYYTVKLRSKSGSSAKKKILQKNNKPSYKIQDIIGIRIMVNFVDDINILKKIFKIHPLNIIESQSVQEYKSNEFGIMKTNYVWNMNEDSEYFSMLGASPEQLEKIKKYKEEIFDKYPIDQTFEIQVRTSTFDSYHEIDHEMRYKNGDTWDKNKYPEENRRFNGILATLEICDWSISQLIDDMAHEQYIQKNWVQMFQHRYKVKLNPPKPDSQEEKILMDFCKELDKDKSYAHDVYKLKRDKLIIYLWNNKEDKDAILNYTILIRAIKHVLES